MLYWEELRKRIGRFRIARRMLEGGEADGLMRLFGAMIVVRAEMLYECDCIEYTAMSLLFEPVPEGEQAPDYMPIFHYESGEFERVEFKPLRSGS